MMVYHILASFFSQPEPVYKGDAPRLSWPGLTRPSTTFLLMRS